jgi:DNA topoisomerase IB
VRLRCTDLGKPGYGRRRRGRGVTFLDRDGEPITDAAEIERLRGLVIPPAWKDVWISPDPRGHIQATGVDAAGRKQYIYHPQWRTQRDEAKFDHVLQVARRLPDLRKRIGSDLDGRGLSRPRVLASIAQLLDMGMFRIGSDQYAAGDDPTFGLATLRPEHARSRDGCVILEFPAKGGTEQIRRITDPKICAVLRELRRRRRAPSSVEESTPDGQRLFGYWDGRRWRDVHADDVNEYLRDASGYEMTAKDFRTWHATVLAATKLATIGPQRTQTGRKRTIAAVMREVADLLGNTPTVARTSYVDTRVVDLYHDGEVAPIGDASTREATERAVLDLLS